MYVNEIYQIAHCLSRKKTVEQQRSSFESKRLLQRTFNVDINDPEQPLLLDAENSSSASKSDLATIHSAVSSSNQKNSHQEWNITKKQEFEKSKTSKNSSSGENNPSKSGSPLPSGVIPSGLRSRSPQVNSGWL